MSKSKVIWYEDPNGSGDIYRDDVDKKGKPIRIWRTYTTEEPSRAESSATPRTRRESVYDRPSYKSTSDRQRQRSRIRESTREDRRPSYTDNGRREPYAEDSGRYADEPSEAYFDSSRQTSTSYQPRDAFEPSSSSRQTSSPQPRHPSPRPFDPGTGDPLADSFNALHVSSDEYYTHSPIAASASLASTARDWQPRALSGRREDTSFLPPERDSSEQVYTSHDNHEQEPLSTAQTQQDPQDRVVTASAGETIDPSYQVRNSDWKDFFRIGRVFSTLWTDSLGNNASKVDPTFVSEVKYGEWVYSKIRRFIVVREGDRSVSCLPVTSYASAGIRKSGIRLNEHGFIYSRKKPGRVEEMCSKPLKLNIARGAAHLKDPSLVNYGKVYNVETNVKVKNVGTLDEESKDILLRYYRRIFGGADPDPASVTPRPRDAVLAGVGAALHAWPAPATPGPYASATSGSEFVSASTASDYPPSSSMLGAPHQGGAHAGPSLYYPPSSQYETPSSASYYPTSNNYGMGSALDPGFSSYNPPSMHSQTQYPSTQMPSSPRGLTYSSHNTMDPSHRSSAAYYPASNRDSYPYQQQSSTAFQSNNPGYSGNYYQQPPSGYPLTSGESGFYSQSGGGFGQFGEQYPPGYSNRLPYSEPALPSAYNDDDIDLSVDPAHEAALAKKRRENRSDGRRRPPGR